MTRNEERGRRKENTPIHTFEHLLFITILTITFRILILTTDYTDFTDICVDFNLCNRRNLWFILHRGFDDVLAGRVGDDGASDGLAV